MKIEKVNDYQIRCTLTKADLAARELKLSELAYGTDKAKALFRDMIQQASLKYGFEAENIPLMIEAVPMNTDCIVLIITKVEDPEELDTRFSRFSPDVIGSSESDEFDDLDESEDITNPASDFLDLFNRIKEEASRIKGAEVSISVEEIPANATNEGKAASPVYKVFSFPSIYEIITPARLIRRMELKESSLYQDEASDRYLLILHSDEYDSTFNKACNILSEYGTVERLSSSGESYLEEHYSLLMKGDALQRLGKVETE